MKMAESACQQIRDCLGALSKYLCQLDADQQDVDTEALAGSICAQLNVLETLWPSRDAVAAKRIFDTLTLRERETLRYEMEQLARQNEHTMRRLRAKTDQVGRDLAAISNRRKVLGAYRQSL